MGRQKLNTSVTPTSPILVATKIVAHTNIEKVYMSSNASKLTLKTTAMVCRRMRRHRKNMIRCE